jgi:hypothetical protein
LGEGFKFVALFEGRTGRINNLKRSLSTCAVNS